MVSRVLLPTVEPGINWNAHTVGAQTHSSWTIRGLYSVRKLYSPHPRQRYVPHNMIHQKGWLLMHHLLLHFCPFFIYFTPLTSNFPLSFIFLPFSLSFSPFSSPFHILSSKWHQRKVSTRHVALLGCIVSDANDISLSLLPGGWNISYRFYYYYCSPVCLSTI